MSSKDFQRHFCITLSGAFFTYKATCTSKMSILLIVRVTIEFMDSRCKIRLTNLGQSQFSNLSFLINVSSTNAVMVFTEFIYF
jgi:hypothetical protein